MTPSLKGITCTNDDPNLCAVCSIPFPKGCYTDVSVVAYCCGKRTCEDCCNNENGHCRLCKTTVTASKVLALLKKEAKRGRPWAQFYLGTCFGSGFCMAQSSFDAVRWYRKAAAQGHPEACFGLGLHCFRGDGCAKDLSEAQKYAEKTMILDANLVHDVHDLLAWIGGEYMKRDEVKEGERILTPLAEAGVGDAQHNLGLSLFHNDTYDAAEKWLVSAAVQGIPNSALWAMGCCGYLGKPVQPRFWLGIATKEKGENDISDTAKKFLIDSVNDTRAGLRKLRDTCGGCGAALDGKMRKICKQCKVYCYCDRECQKLHWNKRKDGHRNDCMEVLDLKDKMKSAAEKSSRD